MMMLIMATYDGVFVTAACQLDHDDDGDLDVG